MSRRLFPRRAPRRRSALRRGLCLGLGLLSGCSLLLGDLDVPDGGAMDVGATRDLSANPPDLATPAVDLGADPDLGAADAGADDLADDLDAGAGLADSADLSGP